MIIFVNENCPPKCFAAKVKELVSMWHKLLVKRTEKQVNGQTCDEDAIMVLLFACSYIFSCKTSKLVFVKLCFSHGSFLVYF